MNRFKRILDVATALYAKRIVYFRFLQETGNKKIQNIL